MDVVHAGAVLQEELLQHWPAATVAQLPGEMLQGAWAKRVEGVRESVAHLFVIATLIHAQAQFLQVHTCVLRSNTRQRVQAQSKRDRQSRR